MKRVALITLSVMVFAVLALVVLDKLLPYSVNDFIEINARFLRTEIRAWRKSGGKESGLQAIQITNELCRVYQFNTNLIWEGRTVRTFLRLDSPMFRGKGYIVAGDDGKIFWIPQKGRAKVIE